MARVTRTFTNLKSRPADQSDAYSDDGGRTWYWSSVNRPCPLDACRDYGIPCDPVAQQKARDDYNDKFLADYRKVQRNRKPSAEEMFEMRAAFGRGTTVVNVITGRKIRL